MIIILMLLGAIGVFISVMFTKRMSTRVIFALISGIVFVASTALMTVNYSHHFGMHQVTTTRTRRIYSASNSTMPLAIYQPVGKNGQDDVCIYNTKKHQQKPHHTPANEYTHNRLRHINGTQARLITKETRWRYNGNWARILFAGSGMDGNLVKRTNTFEYPQAYVKLSTKQAQRLAQAAKKNDQQKQAAVQQQGRAYVSNHLKAAMAKNPQMSTKQIRQLTQQAELEFQSKLIHQMLQQ